MTESKWYDIMSDEAGKMNTVLDIMPHNPYSWPQLKDAMVKFIKNVDEATEVYNMENDNVTK